MRSATRTLSPLERLFDRIAGTDAVAVAVLLLVALLSFAPGFATMPPMDRDEPRFAQASKQMLESGDFVTIRFQDEARLKKPVGIYWLQTAAVAAGEALGVPEARTTIALYRIPSLLAALGAVVLTWWTALPLVGRRPALLAGFAMAVSVLLGVEARLAKTDAVLLLTILAMMGVLARLWMRRDDAPPPSLGLAATFWTAFAASVLVKGPIGLMVAGLAMVAASLAMRRGRWLRGLRPLPGLAWTLLLVLPWFVAIMIATNGTFLEQSVGRDMMAKVAGGQESHGAPPGLYLALVWATFWPVAPLAPLAAPWVWRNRRLPAVAFLLAWLVPCWLVFEAVPTKLPHYVLPLYPALAILISAAVCEDGLVTKLWGRIVLVLVPLLGVALPVAALVAIWHFEGSIAWLVLPGAILVPLLAAAAWWRYARAHAVDGVLLSGAAAVVLYWTIYAAGMPSLPALWPSVRLAAAARALDCPDPGLASAGFREPSLVFLAGTRLQLVDGAGAADFLKEAPCRMAFVERREEDAFRARSAGAPAPPSLVGRVAGFNTNGGRTLDIGVYRSP